MKKPWSITTTLRNPERLRSFLIVLKQLEGYRWDLESQRKYQILLIKERVYGYGSRQFYNGLSQAQIDLIDDQAKDISFEQATEIFNAKDYESPAMRGRQSINPLKKLGLVSIKDEKVFITSLGELFLKEDFDLGEIFFRSFIKWQLPNPSSSDYKLDDGYDIKPFIGVLHLIKKVNEESTRLGEKAKGISKEEFCLFGPTLINHSDIEDYANEIVELRNTLKNKTKIEQKAILNEYKKAFIKSFLGSANATDIKKFLKNLKDYGDNAIRYFRLTRYISIRGKGFYIDLEPRRAIEIDNLLQFDNAQSKDFSNKEEYAKYIANISEPKLPWETQEKLIEIVSKLLEEIRVYETKTRTVAREFLDYSGLGESDLKIYAEDLRKYRRELQDNENHQNSQDVDKIKEYIANLEDIFNSEDKPIALEKLSSLGLNALNDALKIQPNYPVGDDNEPTFTAPANVPDIECFYEDHNAICEVTMLTGRDQWYNEGQPVMRHLRDFEDKHSDKNSYCLFIAPSLHRDTLNTFWTAVKYEYEGQRQRIIPLSINNFVEILKILVQIKQSGRTLKHDKLFYLYDEILELSGTSMNSSEWTKDIPNIIASWQKSFNL